MARHSIDRHFATPRVGVSACLELDACRPDGSRVDDPFVRRLADHVDTVAVCPEIEIGLGVPRDPLRLVDDDGGTQLVETATGERWTEEMATFAERWLDRTGPLDGWILKDGSPTCGVRSVEVHSSAQNGSPVRREAGRFARLVLSRHGEIPVESNRAMRDARTRRQVLTRLFAIAEIRELGDDPHVSDLVDFQRRHKHLLMTYDPEAMRELGSIAANPDGVAIEELYRRYARTFRDALSGRPSRSAYVNTLQHMYGHLKEHLEQSEQSRFFETLEAYRSGERPLERLLETIRGWVEEFEYDYFADQSLLAPYPDELLEPAHDRERNARESSGAEKSL